MPPREGRLPEIDGVIAAVREAHAPDSRVEVFDIQCEPQGEDLVVAGAVTQPAAAAAVLGRIGELWGGGRVIDQLVRLPDPALTPLRAGLVRSAIAPLHAEPRPSATQLSQYVLGSRIELLARSGQWYRVRGEDSYLGWMHGGYLALGDSPPARSWEGADPAELVVALGGELLDERREVLVRLPWGARLLRAGRDAYRLPDGRRGSLIHGEIVPVKQLYDRFPPQPDRIVATARRWLGASYLWGGVTPWGADCSGFVQSVFRLHGLQLPRDSDMQARVGRPLDAGERFEALRPADLLFFAESPGRVVSHVAIAIAGPAILHCSLARGGTAADDLLHDGEVGRRLRSIYVGACRLLED